MLLVCGIGVGFAYNALTSEQDVNQNTLEDEYIVLKTNSTNVLDTVAFDTVTDGTNITKYKVHLDPGAENITLDGDDESTPMLKISKADWKVNVTKDTTQSTSYKLDITVSDDFTPIAGLHYVMVINGVADEYDGGWEFTGLSYDQPNGGYTVALYVFGETTADPRPSCGFTNYVANSTEGSVFTFVATAL